ncbi:MAG: hypothetical protein WBP42_02480 [Candidatus Zixiibacteriota bacterium]
MSHITVDAVVSLKLKLPPESAAIISEIIIGDRVFAPSGEHQYEIPTNVVATAVDDFEQKIADGAVEKKEQPTKKVTSPAKSKGGGKLANRICENNTCKKSFTPKSVRGRFCSDKCAQKVYSDKYLQKTAKPAKPTKPPRKPTFGAAGAPPEVLGERPRSYARQGD